MTDTKAREAFQKWYRENVSPCFVDEHCGTYEDAHAIFGRDALGAWEAALSWKAEHDKAALAEVRRLLQKDIADYGHAGTVGAALATLDKLMGDA